MAALALMTACGDDTTSVEPLPPVTRIQLTHLTRIMFVDEQITIEVYAFDAQRRRLETPPLQWFSSDPAIASVDGAGRVTGHAVGSVMIRASAGTLADSIRIDVRDAVLAIVTQQGPRTLLIGESAIFHAEFRSSTGKLLAVPEHATWATADRDVLELAAIPGFDASYVRVTGRATGLASLSVGTESKVSIQIVGVIPEPVPSDAPLRVNNFYFFNYWGGYLPTMQIAVSPGRSVEVMRLEVSVPGMLPATLPPLCSTGKLAAGQHSVLGLTSYPAGVLSWYSFYSSGASDGAALLTYRTDDGRVIRTVIHGMLDAWGYDSGYTTQFPWKVCNS